MKFGNNYFNPRRSNNFLDTCAFDPKVEPEASCANKIRNLSNEGKILLILSHTNQKEIEHPNTPKDVLAEARAMIHTLSVQMTSDELFKQKKIHEILRGHANPEAHYADATHIAESTKYGGCFITTDKRILSKRDQLLDLGAVILSPSEWIEEFNRDDI
ncbi:MAG: hypothetical protein KGI13_08195 [Betaproteobacteria bacterium]|nr:hypothetical protein [Betaproteobacteria bacterium]